MNSFYWLATIYVPEIMPSTFLKLHTHFNSIENVFKADETSWRAVGLQQAQIKSLQQVNWQSVERDLTWSEQSSHHIISWDSPAYPDLLRTIAEPPLVLFVRGHAQLLKQHQLAIVGTRHASVMGLENAEQFAYALAKEGIVITSGMACGIDGAAHRGALKAKGLTIGVAGTGMLHTYPATNRLLIEQIAQEGAVISEFSLASPPRAHHFPRRNRIISGLSLGTLVIEAAIKSGSLSTARHAIAQNREIFALPGSIHHPLSRGCHYLIRQGAKLVEKVEDILEEFAYNQKSHKKTEYKEKRQILNKAAEEILSYIGYEITPMDMIICRSRLTAGEVSSILLILELHGYIQSIAGGYVRMALQTELE